MDEARAVVPQVIQWERLGTRHGVGPWKQMAGAGCARLDDGGHAGVRVRDVEDDPQ